MTVQEANYDSTVTDMLTVMAPKRMKQLENLDAPFLASIKKVPTKGVEKRVRIKSGQNRSFSWIADGGSLIDGDVVRHESYALIGKILRGALEVPKAAATQVAGDGVATANFLLEGLDDALATGVQLLNHAVINGTEALGTITATQGGIIKTSATAGAGSTPIDTVDIPLAFATAVRDNQGLDIYQGATKVFSVYVAGRTPDFLGGTHNLKFQSTGEFSGSAWTPANGDAVHLRGIKEEGPTGIVEIADSTIALYGVTLATPGWQGNELAVGGAGTESHFRKAKVQVKNRAGNTGKVDKWLMNENRLSDIYGTFVNSKIVFTGTKVDIGDHETLNSLAGVGVVLDENCPDDIALGLNYGDFQLNEFAPMIQDGDGTPGKDKGKLHFKSSDTAFKYTAEVWGMWETEVTRRSSFVKLTGLTA